ncbi:MAG: FmdB family transcriptional regulator [Deltaproteobacteria bacterium]|nr:MAG: FmdB family transcriptional regulator [Deltaproteobacteria bacterium]
MPLFEFSCNACDALFEELTSSTTPTTIVCPQCGSTDVHKMVSATAITRQGTSLSPGNACGGSGGFS